MIDAVIDMNSRSRGVMLVLVLGCVGLACLAQTPTPLVQIHFISVSRGDASLLVGPTGETVLIDGGGEGSGVADYLSGLGVERLNLVVATNGREEHIGGLIDVLRSLRVDQVATSGVATDSVPFRSFDEAITTAQARRAVVDRGDRLQVGALTLEVLNPDPLAGSDPAESSIVVRVVCPEGPSGTLGTSPTSFLFTSDIDAATENGLLLSGLPLRSGVLQVASHGSCASSSGAFLNAVAPEMAVVNPAGGGDPCPAVLARLDALGATVWRTDMSGTVVVESACFVPSPTSNEKPNASFVFSPSEPTPGEAISVDASGSTDADGTIVSYVWTFSDGTTTTGPMTRHSYAAPGTYWICLIVADNAGGTGTQCQQVIVPAVADVRIDCVYYAGSQVLREADEYVQIVNVGTKAQDLSGWVLRNLSRATPSFTFKGIILQPGATVRVYTNEPHPEWGGFFFGLARGIWSNGQSDTAALFDAAGEIASQCSYRLGNPGQCSGCTGQ